jgi:hypothetical protein
MTEQPLALTDDQLQVITVAARSLPQSRRHRFLARIEARLKGSVLDDATLRAAVDATGREMRSGGA